MASSDSDSLWGDSKQLQQAIKTLQLSLPELELVVRDELDRCWCGQKHSDAFTDAQGRAHRPPRKR